MATWAPTVRRGPIAGEYVSPGPAYGLPTLMGQPGHDTRSIHRKAPAYHFGLKRAKFTDDCSPGPAYHPDSKQYRDGKDGTPHYSLSSRNRSLTTLVVPGAGTYAPESAGEQSHFRHPAYSFGTRHRQRRSDSSPGANRYTLPPMLGKTYQSGKSQAPCFSMVPRSKIGSFHEDLQRTPGPGAYGTTAPSTYKDKSPQYSMVSRNVMPGDATQKPGPGAHNMPLPGDIKKKSPAFSFGVRHSSYTAPVLFNAED